MAVVSNITTPVPKAKKRKVEKSEDTTVSASTSKLPAPPTSANGATASTPKKRKKDKTNVVANGAGNGHDVASAVTVLDAIKSKGKAKAGSDTDFRTVQASVVLSLPPLFAGDLRAGAAEMLDSLLMRYVPALGGVVLSHSDLSFPERTARIKGDCPFAIITVHFSALTWAPAVGMTLRGKLSLSSPDHVALLVHRTFNASIPRHHIPSDLWTFEHGPAENDPEFGWGRQDTSNNNKPDSSGDEKEGQADRMDTDAQPNPEAEGEGDAEDPSLGGRWINTRTNEPLGGSTGIVEFMVIGMTAAHRMLSLLGSLQADPFNPAHVPGPQREEVEQEDDDEEVGEEEHGRGTGKMDAVYVEVDDGDSAVGDDDGDAAMGREEEEEEDVPLNEEAEELARREALKDQERETKKKAKEREEKRKRKEERKKAKADAEAETVEELHPKAKKRKTKSVVET